MSVKLFDANNLHRLPWPTDENGDYARHYLKPMIQEKPLAFIDNADVEMQALLVDEKWVLPLILTNPQARIKNSYVGSNLSHYIDYAIEELQIELSAKPWHSGPGLLRLTGAPVLHLCGLFFKACAIEKAVFVNNWLLSTNLYPTMATTTLAQIRDFLVQWFPDRAIIFKSINDQLTQPLLAQLRELDFSPILSRQIYLLDPAKGLYRKTKSYQKDLGLNKRSPYSWLEASEIASHHIPRLRTLYDDLYLHKYSTLNPQFNTRFLEYALKYQWLRFFILTQDHRIDAMIGYFVRDGVMTAPLVGYDRSLPVETGLYRLISLKLFQEAITHRYILHQSSGASEFKRTRGGEPSLEYNMVFSEHLSQRQQLPWLSLNQLSEKTLIPFMRKYQL